MMKHFLPSASARLTVMSTLFFSRLYGFAGKFRKQAHAAQDQHPWPTSLRLFSNGHDVGSPPNSVHDVMPYARRIFGFHQLDVDAHSSLNATGKHTG